MQNVSPLLDMILPTDDASCDSPSGSSTSEPHDEAMNNSQPFIDQSFFYKLDQLSPDNPLFFMQQSENRPRQSEELDTPMDAPSPLSAQASVSMSSPQSMSTQGFMSAPSSIVEPLQPANSLPAESSQTFWSGFNNFFSNVTHNPFPQAIPNLARNFTDYLSNYPIQFSSPVPDQSSQPSPPPHAVSPIKYEPSLDTPFSQSPITRPLDMMKTPGMQIRVLGVPQTGAKSRVETQIKLCIQLVTDDGDKAQWWSHLKLPEHMVAKDKLKRQVMMANAQNGLKVDGANLPIKPERMLFLSARVICASDPSRKVVTCLGCIQRERKRSQRRKENKIKTDNEDDNRSMEDDKSLALEEQKVLLFNCSEIVDFSSGDTILPTRITCYCRHHNERLGFCIYFEMHDQTGKQVATGMSPPIMITDDHKSNKIKAGRKRPRTDVESHTPLISSGGYEMNSGVTAPNMLGPPRFRVPYGSYPNVQTLREQQFSLQPRPVDHVGMNHDVNHLANPNSNTMHRQQFDASSGPKIQPNSIVPSMATQTHPTPMVTENTVQQTVTPTPILNDRPQLQRLIPNEGPTYGGIEVTILGSGFRPGLTCLFGDAAASSTHYWSPNTLVCILPPAVEPGTVVVSFKEYPMVMDSQDVTLFTYFNENDRALMELALQVVGLKMTGKVEDARAIAMRIVQGGNQNQQSSSGTSNQDNQQNQNQNQNQNQTCLERHIIQVLEVMDIMEDVDSVDVSLTSGQGHTMLHLAAILNFSKLTRTLIELGCNVDTMDRNGNTALHYAAMFGHEDLAKILLDDGKADSGIVNQWNKRPMHLSKDNTMRLILHTYMPVDADEVSDSCGASVSSDMLGADVDTSFSDESSYDDDVISLDGDRVDRNEINQRWLQFYQSDSSASAQSELYEEGLRNRRRPTLNIQSIQYLEDDGDLHSPDEIMDAEAVHNNHIDTSSDTDDDGDMSKADLKSTWMQRTLSHLQQEKDKHLSYVTDNTFVQNIKNNMPAKPTELNLKTIADHVLQFPRPTEMIANMSVMFSQDQAKGSSTDEPEQTLAWYMALAYSIGAGSRSLPEQPIRPLDQKQPEMWQFDNKIANASSAQPSRPQPSSMGPEAIADQKRRDRRLFSLWVPLLCFAVIWLIFQFVSSHPGVIDFVVGISGFRHQYLRI